MNSYTGLTRLAFKLFKISISILFLAWLAKFRFIPGGDNLFRLASAGVALSLILPLTNLNIKANTLNPNLRYMIILNCCALIILYLGMMVKVSHLVDDPFVKDILLDIIGIPLMLIAILYSFTHYKDLLHISELIKTYIVQFIALPWLLFLFSYLFYLVYSMTLIRAIMDEAS